MAVAGALSATAVATVVGLGANLGLFDLTQPDSGAGRLDSTHVSVTTPPSPPTPTATPAAHDGRSDDD